MNAQPHASLQDLLTGLGVPECGLVALCGAGGKTTLMYRLAAQAVARGWDVVCATTTRVFVPHVPRDVQAVLLENDTAPETALAACSLRPVLLAAGPEQSASPHHGATQQQPTAQKLPAAQKLRGVAPETLDRLHHAFPRTLFLVEADGAARKPLKAPASHEPVFPACTTLTVAVVGLDALHRPLSPGLVHRPERVTALTGLPAHQPVTVQTLRGLVSHPQGLFQHCPAASRRVVFGNKADAVPVPQDWPTQTEPADAADRAAGGPCTAIRWTAGSAAQGWCL